MKSVKLEEEDDQDSDREDNDRKLEVDMKVEAKYRGKSKYYPGVISRVRLNGTVDINYDDGEKELGVKPELVRVLDDESEEDALKFRKRDKVTYKPKKKGYPATITKVNSDGTYNLKYDGSSKGSEKRVKAKYLQEREAEEFSSEEVRDCECSGDSLRFNPTPL